MTPDEFRAAGSEVIEWIANYMESVEQKRIDPDIAPGAIRSSIADTAPEEPEPFGEILADLDSVIMPGVTHWQSPGWFAYFPANTSGPSILGDLISSALGQQGMLWATSPAATEVETVVVDWLVDLLDLPESWKTTGPGGGVIQGSASDSTHTALVVARELHDGCPTKMVAYTSSQAHSSIEKGARVAGYGHVRLVDVDEYNAMRVDSLALAIEDDRAAGLVPTFVGSTVGTTGTTAIDPVRQIAQVARSNGMWHHVDAAYAGSAMICEEFRHLQDGLEEVDSYTFNPHKWMFTNFDCNVFYVADRLPLINTLSIVPPYLRNRATDGGDVIDYRDWHVPLGRRFRALKLWFVLRSYGASGIRHHIRQHVGMARWFESQVMQHSQLEVIAPTTLALVSFRCLSGERATRALVDAINASGHSYVTPSSIGDMTFIRVSVGQTYTEQRHVESLWKVVAGWCRGH